MRKTLIILAVLSLLGFGAWRYAGSGDTAAEVRTVAVTEGPIRMTIETNGRVEPLRIVEVGCEVTGRVVDILADYDEPVKKGQILCRIDPELAQAGFDQAQADYLKAKSLLADAKIALEEQSANLPVQTQQALAAKIQAEATLADAAYNWKRVQELKESGNAGEGEYVTAQSQWLRAKSGLESAESAHRLAKNNESYVVQRTEQAISQAESALKLAEARLQLAKTQLDRCVIASPIDGIVLQRFCEPGMTVTAEFQTPRLFLLAPSLEKMRVNTKVSESDISHVQSGQTARFSVQGRQRRSFSGTIAQRRNQPDVIQNVVTYTVLFDVENDAERTLLPGLTVDVEIECAAREKALVLTNAALRFTPPLAFEERQALLDAAVWPPQPGAAEGDEAGYCSRASAWRYDAASGRWSVVPLWVGITDNVGTEVLAGAAAGDRFVEKFSAAVAGEFSLKEALRLADPKNRRL